MDGCMGGCMGGPIRGVQVGPLTFTFKQGDMISSQN